MYSLEGKNEHKGHRGITEVHRGSLGGAGDGGAAQAVDYVQHELFYFVGLDLGLGEELRGAEAELAHFGVGDLAAAVDDERESAEVGLLAEPVYERETVAVGECEVEDEEVGAGEEAVLDGVLAGERVVDVDVGVLEAGDDDLGEVGVVFDKEDVGGAVAGVEDAGKLGEKEVLVEGLLHPAGGGRGGVAAELDWFPPGRGPRE